MQLWKRIEAAQCPVVDGCDRYTGFDYTFVVLNRHWRIRNKQYISILKEVFDLCRKITSSVPADVNETDEIVAVLCQSVKSDFYQIFGATDVKILLEEDGQEGEAEEVPSGFCEYELCSPDRKKAVGKLLLALPCPLRKEKTRCCN